MSYHSADLPERTYAVDTFFVYFVYFVVTTPAADPPRIWYNADIIDDSLGSPLAIMICRYVVFAMRRQKKPGTESPIGAVFGSLFFWYCLGVTLCFYIPSLVRRLHDFGRSGWWVVLYCVVQNILRNISFVREGSWLFELAGILLPVLMPGSKGENAYGPPPKGVDLSWVRKWSWVYVVPVVLLGAAFSCKCLCPPKPQAEDTGENICERVLSPGYIRWELRRYS